jgi:glycosyltransferase involved in cell wall biosynthesis
MRFSLIIPCYNESANLPLLLQSCKGLATREGVEIILVDNGSTDDTSGLLARLLPSYPGCRSIRIEVNQGYGFGVLSGLRAARGEILGWTHADMQTDPQDCLAGLNYFEAGHNDIFVKGRRFGRPAMDALFTVGMSIFETVLLARPLWDINAQPTLFHRRFFETWTSPPNDFSLDLYVYYLARVQGLNVHRFPVHFGPRAHGVSHWNVNWTEKKKFIRRTVEFSLELKRNFPK